VRRRAFITLLGGLDRGGTESRSMCTRDSSGAVGCLTRDAGVPFYDHRHAACPADMNLPPGK